MYADELWAQLQSLDKIMRTCKYSIAEVRVELGNTMVAITQSRVAIHRSDRLIRSLSRELVGFEIR